MASEPMLLVINNKRREHIFAVYRRGIELAYININFITNVLHIRTQNKEEETKHITQGVSTENTLKIAIDILIARKVIESIEEFAGVAICISAPSGLFLHDKIIGDFEIEKLQQLNETVPNQIGKTLDNIFAINKLLPNTQILGISDSSFHITKPDYTWNYGINLDDADNFDIKRFGYHGIATESVVKQIRSSKYASYSKVVICQIGEEAAVTAVYNGKSIDTTTGFSINEGPIMSSHSGVIDFAAGIALAKNKNIHPNELVEYLDKQSGLIGLSGCSDNLDELIAQERAGNHKAALALSMYVYSVRQSIAKMISSLEGVDLVVFTGEVGQNSFAIRERIINGLGYLGIIISSTLNKKASKPNVIQALQPRTRSKPLIIVPIKEERAIASHARKLLI